MSKIDMITTIISIVVTSISIGFSIWSFISAKKAKAYKDKAKAAICLIDIQKFVVQFDYESNKFVNDTRNKDWFKGIDAGTIITPFSNILSQFTSIYPIIGNPQQLIDLVTSVYKTIQNYEMAAEYARRNTIGDIHKISTVLHNHLQKAIDDL